MSVKSGRFHRNIKTTDWYFFFLQIRGDFCITSHHFKSRCVTHTLVSLPFCFLPSLHQHPLLWQHDCAICCPPPPALSELHQIKSQCKLTELAVLLKRTPSRGLGEDPSHFGSLMNWYTPPHCEGSALTEQDEHCQRTLTLQHLMLKLKGFQHVSHHHYHHFLL